VFIKEDRLFRFIKSGRVVEWTAGSNVTNSKGVALEDFGKHGSPVESLKKPTSKIAAVYFRHFYFRGTKELIFHGELVNYNLIFTITSGSRENDKRNLNGRL
jgi:hypothetical protein